MSQLVTADGTVLPGFLEDSADAGAPAILVIHEWWGLNEQVRGIARRLAAQGFQAFCVDLYDGTVAKDAAEAAARMQALDAQGVLAALHAAVQALLPRCQGALGVLGYCMGGGYALATAAHNPQVKAAVAFYGIPSAAMADVSRISGKVLGHYASRDRSVTPERVDALERTLRAAGVEGTLYRYAADHAFANERRPEVYAPEAAELAWQRTLAFFHEVLGASPAKR
jgi:carboxymethylenebutenolidase